MNKKKMNLVLAFIMVAILVVMIALLLGNSKNSSEDERKVGIMLTSTKDDGGWNQMNYEGIVKACEEYNLQLFTIECVSEDAESCQQAAQELVDEGVELIILSSYNYINYLKDFVDAHSEVAFYSNSFGCETKNLSSFMARMYQARYLAGILAGTKTQTNVIGYVAAMQNAEVDRGINAFTLGVRSVNSDAVVKVGWTNSWDDEAQEKRITDALIDHADADVITCHQNRATVAEEADQKGVYSIGYNILDKNLSDRYLAAAVFNWEGVYRSILRDFVQGKANQNPIHFVGMEENAIMLTGFSDLVTEDEIAQIDAAQNKILNGWEIFSGEIYDNTGAQRCSNNETISDKTLLTSMDWLVEGAENYEE